MAEKPKENLDRRQLLARAAKAGLAIAAAGAVAYTAYDKNGPPAQPQDDGLVTLPDFSVPAESGKMISVVKGPDRKQTVGKAIELLGGIERFVKPGDVVAIKPNVAFATPAMLGATANPEVVGEVCLLCLKAGAKKVIVMDNPINDPASCFTISGIGRAASEAGAEIAMPKDHLFRNTTLAGGRLIRNWPVFFGPLESANKLIGIAPVKHHHRSGASMTMKNFYGLLGGRRNIFHQDINTIIAELATLVKPTLVILDGTEVMMTNGPTGGSKSDLKRADTMIASCDLVAADSFGCRLLGLVVTDLPYLTKAEDAGAGTTAWRSLKPVEATAS
jgi:uncharacterized protein (DUF362 family)